MMLSASWNIFLVKANICAFSVCGCLQWQTDHCASWTAPALLCPGKERVAIAILGGSVVIRPLQKAPANITSSTLSMSSHVRQSAIISTQIWGKGELLAANLFWSSAVRVLDWVQLPKKGMWSRATSMTWTHVSWVRWLFSWGKRLSLVGRNYLIINYKGFSVVPKVSFRWIWYH